MHQSDQTIWGLLITVEASGSSKPATPKQEHIAGGTWQHLIIDFQDDK